MSATNLAVWGDPIAHSLSPALHAAAYRTLGLDWSYGRRQVGAADFADELTHLDTSWRGLSLTMPLKEQAFRAAVTHDRHAQLTGAVNTLLFGDNLRGLNTDVGGIVDALTQHEIRTVESVRILGAGATAASAMVAVAELGANTVEILARRPERAEPLRQLAEQLGISLSVGAISAPTAGADLTVATLPSGTTLDAEVAYRLADEGGALFDAAYAPWPSALAAAWNEAPVVSGLSMLLGQAVRQVRVFVHGDPMIELDDESRVRDAMRSALPQGTVA